MAGPQFDATYVTAGRGQCPRCAKHQKNEDGETAGFVTKGRAIQARILQFVCWSCGIVFQETDELEG